MLAICLNKKGEYVFKDIKKKSDILELRLNSNLDIIAFSGGLKWKMISV